LPIAIIVAEQNQQQAFNSRPNQRATSPYPAAPQPVTAAEHVNNNRTVTTSNASPLPPRRLGKIERATSPVDARVLKEFYADRPKDMHTYQIEGRQYYVYEGKKLTELDEFRQGEMTTMMLFVGDQILRLR
jgi:hypothetical protein